MNSFSLGDTCLSHSILKPSDYTLREATMRHKRKPKPLWQTGERRAKALAKGYADAKKGVLIEDNFYRKIGAPVQMCAWWESGWNDFVGGKK